MWRVAILGKLKMNDLKNLECLLPETKKLLEKLLERCEFLYKYVLVGGSALTLHLCHRKSEDLYFFTYSESIGVRGLLFTNFPTGTGITGGDITEAHNQLINLTTCQVGSTLYVWKR
jgi:hypothetical protein